MDAPLNHELRVALADGQAVALESGVGACVAASPEAEAGLSRLLAVAAGLFAFSLTAVAGVALLLS